MSRARGGQPPQPGEATADKVVVHGEGVRVDEVDTELPRAEVRHRFGGLDVWAALPFLASAIGALVVLGSLLGAFGAAGFGAVDAQAPPQALSIGGLVLAVLVLAVALLFAGYVAGRVARYAGLRNALLAGVLLLLLIGALAGLAATADPVRDLRLPNWLDQGTATTAALIATVAAIVLGLAAAALGGWLGSRWHRKVDTVLVGTRPGALQGYPALEQPSPASTAPTARHRRKASR